MKKVLSLILATALVFSLAIFASAEKSPSPAPAPVAPTAPAGISVSAGSISVDPWDGNGGVALADKAKAVGGEIMCLFDLSGTGNVTFNANVQAGHNYLLLHYLANGTVETLKPTALSNGSISFNIGSNSPFALVEVLGSVKSPNTAAN